MAILLFSCTLALHARQVDIKLRLDYLWAAQARRAFCVLGGRGSRGPGCGQQCPGCARGPGPEGGQCGKPGGASGEPCPQSVWRRLYEKQGGDGAEGLSVPWLDGRGSGGSREAWIAQTLTLQRGLDWYLTWPWGALPRAGWAGVGAVPGP